MGYQHSSIELDVDIAVSIIKQSVSDQNPHMHKLKSHIIYLDINAICSKQD